MDPSSAAAAVAVGHSGTAVRHGALDGGLLVGVGAGVGAGVLVGLGVGIGLGVAIGAGIGLIAGLVTGAVVGLVTGLVVAASTASPATSIAAAPPTTPCLRTDHGKRNVVGSGLMSVAARMVPKPERNLRCAEWGGELDVLTGGLLASVYFGLQLMRAGIRLRADAWCSATINRCTAAGGNGHYRLSPKQAPAETECLVSTALLDTIFAIVVILAATTGVAVDSAVYWCYAGAVALLGSVALIVSARK